MAKANVATKEESQLPALSLDLMEGDAHSGLENISQDDLATPRLKVLMQLSPELEDLEGAKAGMIYNTVTNDLYDGSNGIRVLPCAYQRQYVEWADRGQGSGAPINVYDASSDILTKTTRDDNNKDRLENGNYVETCGNHYVLLVTEQGDATPALIRCERVIWIYARRRMSGELRRLPSLLAKPWLPGPLGRPLRMCPRGWWRGDKLRHHDTPRHSLRCSLPRPMLSDDAEAITRKS